MFGILSQSTKNVMDISRAIRLAGPLQEVLGRDARAAVVGS